MPWWWWWESSSYHSRRKQEEANSHERKMKQEERAHQIRLKEMEEKRREREAKLENERKRIELEHQRQVEKMKQANKQSLQKEINDYQEKIDERVKVIKELKKDELDAKSELSALTKQQKELPEKIIRERNAWKKQTDFDGIHQKLKSANDEIAAGIKKTGQLESNVGNFLKLTQVMVNATALNQDNANKLASMIETFGENIERNTEQDLSIDYYFNKKEKKLVRLIPILAEESLETMEDLVCDDKEEFEDMVQTINDQIQEQIDTIEENKEDDDDSTTDVPEKLSKQEIRKLEKICLKQKWKKQQEQKEKIAKSALEGMAPVLGKFFNRSYETMQLADKLLSIESRDLNQTQQEAIMNLGMNSIEYNKDQKKENNENNKNNSKNDNDKNNSNNDNDKQKDNTEETKENDDKQVEENEEEYLEEKEEELIEKNTMEVETVIPNTTIVKNTKLLSQAAIKSIHVIQSMQEDFNNDLSQLSFPLAQGIQHSCMQLVRCQGNIRQSWVLANEIIKLKPGNLKPEAKVLWDTVDSGLIQIYENILEMSQVSSKFFGFFLKFNNSFKYFLNANKQDADLMISAQYILKDTKDFQKFSDKFSTQVAKLGSQALEVISNCIKNTVGAEQFEKAIEERKLYRQKYSDLLKELNKKEDNWGRALQNLAKDFYDAEAKLKTIEFQVKLETDNLNLLKKARQKLQEMMDKI